MQTDRAPRSERSVIVLLAFIGVLMAYGIDAVLPAFDDLRREFGLDARGVSPAITGTPCFVGAAIGQLAYGVFAEGCDSARRWTRPPVDRCVSPRCGRRSRPWSPRRSPAGRCWRSLAVALLVNNRLIDRFGVRRMVVIAATAFVLVTGLCVALTLGARGVPSFGVWFGWALVTNALSMIMGPMSVSLAWEPMADKAGTAAAVIGAVQFGGGALLAALVDARIDRTVTPMVVGALVFGVAGLGFLALGLVGSGPQPAPDHVAMSPVAIDLSHPG